jgi:hypothetical protein
MSVCIERCPPVLRAESTRILEFPDSNWKSPDSSTPWCKSRGPRKRSFSHSQGERRLLYPAGVTTSPSTGFRVEGATRWTTTLSSRANLPHATKFRAFCGANLVTLSSKIWGNETLEVHRVEGFRRPGGQTGQTCQICQTCQMGVFAPSPFFKNV